MPEWLGDMGESVSIERSARPREEEAHEAGLPIPRLHGPLRYVVLIGFGVLLVVGVFVLVGKVAGYTKTLDSLKGASPVWLAFCFGSQVISYAAYVVLFRAFAGLGGRPCPPIWLTSRIVFASLGATRLLAAGGVGGIAVFYWALRQLGFGGHQSVVRVFALNTALYATLRRRDLDRCARAPRRPGRRRPACDDSPVDRGSRDPGRAGGGGHAAGPCRPAHG